MATYIFGVFNNGYTQCPNDSTSNILKNLYSCSKATTQIAIHRDGNLMYYCYIRKFGDGKYFGLCNVLTGLYLTKIDSLFSLYEKTTEIMANKGIIVNYAENGELTTSLYQLYQKSEDVALISLHLLSAFNSLDKSPLPSIDFSIAEGSTVSYSANDLNSEIVKASYTFSNTYIYKDEDYNTVQINSYKSVLYRLNKENKELLKKNQKILRQKKQYRNVILLILIVIGCGIGIYFLYNNLNAANNTIVEKDNVISSQTNRIKKMQSSIDSLQREYNEEHNRKVEVEERLTKVCSFTPFVVTSCKVDSEKFSFDYYADEENDVTVTLKAINEKNSEIVSNSHSITVTKGTGSQKLSFNYKLSGSDYYFVVLMYDGHIIAGKRW